MTTQLPKCDACGDHADYVGVGPFATPLQWKGRVLCQECYDELAHGNITNQNVNFFGGPLSGSTPNGDDDNPYQSNAIRNMEDG